jgi:hypothetical protein
MFLSTRLSPPRLVLLPAGFKHDPDGDSNGTAIAVAR